MGEQAAVTPAYFNQTARLSLEAWQRCVDASLDIRLADRLGDTAEVERARQNHAELSMLWYKARRDAEEALRSALALAGFDTSAVIQICRSITTI